MSSEDWQPSRLIPTSGISGAEEAERRATSALLAVMSAVTEFGVVLTKPVGAPNAWLSTYVEVPFKLDGRNFRPDGLIRASRAGKDWTCLVEVKTGASTLDAPQVEAYLDIAREQKFDAVLTISNELPFHPEEHPVRVDKRKTRSVQLFHLAWSEIVAAAVIQRVHRGVADPDQAWILGELIRYLKHPKSGADQFSDMGEDWTSVREAVELGTIRQGDRGVGSVLENWERTLRASALHFAEELGVEVAVQMSRAERSDAKLRLESSRAKLVERGMLDGVLRVDGAVGDVSIEADLKAKRLNLSVDIDAPKEGRSTTRINWLLRQLKDAEGSLVVDAWTQGSRNSLSEKLEVVRNDQTVLIPDGGKDIVRLRVTQVSQLGMNRRSGAKSFVEDVSNTTWGFYSGVVQGLTRWTPKAPQAPKGGASAAESAGIDIRYQPERPPARQTSYAWEGRQVVDPVHQAVDAFEFSDEDTADNLGGPGSSQPR